jgi:hypothetical protein
VSRVSRTPRSYAVVAITGAVALLLTTMAGIGVAPARADEMRPSTLAPAAAARPAGVKVPKTVGVSGKAAIAILKKAGFKVLVDRPVHSKTIGRYRIALQNARGGKLVKRRSTIRVAWSLGSVPVIVWKTAQASFFGGAGETQSVAGPYPNTGYMNAHGPYYFAHKTMLFGTKVAFNHNGRTIVAVCADRGPYAGSRSFDLGANLAHKLGFDVGVIRWAYVR